MAEYLQVCFSGPNLPASILLILVCAYWLLVILGGLDLDGLDVDFDVDVDGNLDMLTSAGWITLRFLNLGQVPLMLWMSVFGLCWWLLSMLMDHYFDNPEYRHELWHVLQIIVRNIAISIVLTKIITQPLRGKFDVVEPVKAEELIGRECVIATGNATETSGQARVSAEGGAPLLLNIHTEEGTLAKGDRAVIVDFDPDKHIYLVAKAKQEV